MFFDNQGLYNFTVHIDHHGYDSRVCLGAILPTTLPTCALTFDDIQEVVETIRAYLDLELVLQSLDRMQDRAPVEGCELRLRGRDGLRIKAQSEQVLLMSNGHRRPTALRAPVSTMMEGLSGRCMS